MATNATGNMGDGVPKTKRVLPHSASVGEITLEDEMGNEYDLEGADEVAVLGYEIISTTGDFVIPREWLLDTMQAVGLPDWMAPRQVSTSRAHGRAVDDLLDDGWNKVENFSDIPLMKMNLLESDDHDGVTLQANVFYPPDWTGDETGEWKGVELGVILYDREAGRPRFVDKIDDDKELYKVWERFQMRFAELFDMHTESHNGKDINTMFNQYFINQWTRSVRLRDAVYFVPATVEGVKGYVDGFEALYAAINEEKDKSGQEQDTEVIKLPVYDNGDQRDMVQRKVRSELEDAVETAYGQMVKKMKNDDTVAEDVAAAMADRFDEMGATASGYKSIIQTELAVEEVMQDQLDQLDDADSHLISDVVDEITDEI